MFSFYFYLCPPREAWKRNAECKKLSLMKQINEFGIFFSAETTISGKLAHRISAWRGGQSWFLLIVTEVSETLHSARNNHKILERTANKYACNKG